MANKETNFERITKDEYSLMHFVMLEVLDLAGPHMDHDTRHFRTGIKFREWLRKEVDKQEGFDDFSVNEQTIFAFQELDVRDMTDEELNYAGSTANNIMLDIQKEQRKREFVEE